MNKTGLRGVYLYLLVVVIVGGIIQPIFFGYDSSVENHNDFPKNREIQNKSDCCYYFIS